MPQASTHKAAAPFGSWASPFLIEGLADQVVFLSEPRAQSGVRWWLEGRSDEGGRQVFMGRDPDGSVVRMTPEGFNTRSRAHEMGGAATLVSGDLLVVSDFTTGRLYRVVAPGELVPITPERAWRFADAVHDAPRNRLIAVREDHEPDAVASHGECINDIVSIDLASGDVRSIASGADFYAAPRLSPDGRSLAWTEWCHPNMPWDGTELLLAHVDDAGDLGPASVIAGSAHDWISQPRWSPGGILHFVAEPDGWMNLHRYVDGRIEAIAPMEADFAPPEPWFGNSTYGFLPSGEILAVARSSGRDRLLRIKPDGSQRPVDVPYSEIGALVVDGDHVVLRAVSPIESASIVEVTLDGSVKVLRRATPFTPEPQDVSIASHIEFPTTRGRTAYGNFYAPKSRSFEGPPGEKPPLIVTSHGGPTASAFAGFATVTQAFTSRGYAVLDVDYGGSTGYGRDYRKRLEGEWGVVDVDDCEAGAVWLAEQGLVDGERMAIRGGSASGFTTLAALAFRDTFRAGTTYFGVGDLRAWAKDTHKFESHYIERLVGPWPETQQRYFDRSPAFHANRIRVPVLVQQGAEDRVVPPSEAERIVDALYKRRVPHAYLLFPGEDHGMFRGKDAIVRSFGAELSFYAQVFGFEPADDIEPLEITFLGEARGRTRV